MGDNRGGTGEVLPERETTAGSGSESVSVLHVDDDESCLSLTKRTLEGTYDASVVTETDPEAALDRVGEVDCVVSDYDMPGMDGIEFLQAVRAEYPDLPFILFTGKGDEAVAGEAIRAGVTDYIRKAPDRDRFTVLANRVTNAVERYRAEKQAAASTERLRRIYERIDDGFAALDREGRFIYVNQRAAEMLDASPDELLGSVIWDAFPGAVDSRFEVQYRYALEAQETVTFEEYFEPLEAWFEVRAFPSESGLSLYFRDVTERKERELRHEAIFNNTYQFMGLLEPDGTLLEANDTALAFVGADREDVVGEPLWETPWFQGDDGTVAIARRSVETARDGELYRDEFPIEGADGETIVIDYSVRPVRDETGEVTLLVPEGRDITELKERERQLREERAFTESLFAAMPDVFYAFDDDWQFIRWNDRLSEVTGYTDDEIAGMTPLDFVPDDEREAVIDRMAAVFGEDRVVTLESAFETKDGERIPYEFTGAPLADDDGTTVGLVGVGRDIRGRRQRERRFEAVFNKTYQFTGLLEPDGTLLEANDTALEFGGIERDDAVGKPLWETPWFEPVEEAREAAREAIETARTGEFYRDEIAVQGDDRTAIIDFSVKPVFDDRGEVILLVPEGRDITELKERERQLRTKNDQLEEFASVISHDLKNPLTVATGSIQLARRTGDEEALDDAADALDRMQVMVDDLLELARQETGVTNLVPVPTRSLLATVEADTGIDVRADLPSNAAIVAEEQRLYSLVCNLVNNAVEHGAGSADPEAPADGVDRGEGVTVEVGLEGDTLYVADDGEGIPEERRDEIFETGVSWSEEGTGFGLAIVDTIVDAHGWEIDVTESRWGGARFEVSGLDVRSVE